MPSASHRSFATLALALALAGRAAAVAPEIKDEGKFFSPEAVKKANEEIRQISRKFDRDLLVETYATVPGNQVEKVKGLSREERNKFFQTWATERAEAAVVNGVYILVCKEPPHLQVEVSSKARTALGNDGREKLIEVLISKFRDKKYDEGLVEAIRLVRDRFAARARP